MEPPGEPAMLYSLIWVLMARMYSFRVKIPALYLMIMVFFLFLIILPGNLFT